MIFWSLSGSVLSSLSISALSDSASSSLSVGSSELAIRSSMLPSSSSEKGASTLRWRLVDEAFMASSILSSGKSTRSTISSKLGLRSNSCSNLLISLLILLTLPTWLSGRRTILLCSAMACRMLWRIHHTA